MKRTIIFFDPADEPSAPSRQPRPIGSRTVSLVCLHCQRPFEKPIGEYNYNRKKGIDRFFCGKPCSHAARRHDKTVEQKKAEKAKYDDQYRRRDYVKAKKADYFKRTYDPVKAAIQRKKTMPRHLAYCRRPEYRTKKRDYDQVHRAKKEYGDYWESFLLVNQIQAQYDDKAVRQENNLHNKSQKRKRAWHKLHNNSNSTPLT